jgi:hypothetical protein
MTTALEGGEWSAARPGHILPAGKTRYPLYRRLGGPQGRYGQVRKIMSGCRLDLSDSGEGTVVVYCERTNEHSISVTCGGFFCCCGNISF